MQSTYLVRTKIPHNHITITLLFSLLKWVSLCFFFHKIIQPTGYKFEGQTPLPKVRAWLYFLYTIRPVPVCVCYNIVRYRADIWYYNFKARDVQNMTVKKFPMNELHTYYM